VSVPLTVCAEWAEGAPEPGCAQPAIKMVKNADPATPRHILNDIRSLLLASYAPILILIRKKIEGAHGIPIRTHMGLVLEYFLKSGQYKQFETYAKRAFA
jgi:hypothetical protein